MERRRKHTWIWVFLSGLVLLAAMNWALATTSNPSFVPTVLVIGAFLIPVSLVIYIHERAGFARVPPPHLSVTFLWGGALGLVVAGLAEHQTIREIGVVPLAEIAFIEELAKLIVPVILFARGTYRSEAAGLLFGVTSGMGFAALETMGYGFVAFMQSHGSIGDLEQTLLMRSLLSPLGHAAWTGFACAALWRGRAQRGRAVRVVVPAAAFLVAVLLHTSWDLVGVVSSVVGAPVLVNLGGLLFVGAISLSLLLWRARHAERAALRALEPPRSETDDESRPPADRPEARPGAPTQAPA